MDLRDAKAQVLRASRPWDDDPVGSGRQARYTHGSIDGREVPDYTAEPGVDPARNTETLAELIIRDRQLALVRGAVPATFRQGVAGAPQGSGWSPSSRCRTCQPGCMGRPIPDQFRLSMGPDRMALEMNINGPNDPLGAGSSHPGHRLESGPAAGVRGGSGWCAGW